MSLQFMDVCAAEAKSGRPPKIEPEPPRRVWSLNVLLVDDDPADTLLILNVLRRHPQVAAAQAVDFPKLVLRKLRNGRLSPDLVLLDINMPRLDGFAFLKKLREIEGLELLPVVFLTTSCLARDVKRTKRSTASLYVVKPDTYFELQARLDLVLRRAASGGLKP